MTTAYANWIGPLPPPYFSFAPGPRIRKDGLVVQDETNLHRPPLGVGPMTGEFSELARYGGAYNYNYTNQGPKRVRLPDTFDLAQALKVTSQAAAFSKLQRNPPVMPPVTPQMVEYEPGELVSRMFPTDRQPAGNGFYPGDPRLRVSVPTEPPLVDPRQYAASVLKRVAEAELKTLEDFEAELERKADAAKEEFMKMNNSRASIMEGDGRVEVPDALEKLAGELRDADMASRKILRVTGLRSIGNGLGAGDIRDAFAGNDMMGFRDAVNTALPDDEMQVHTSEDALAATNQDAILDETERTELDKLNHPLSHEWVRGLPDIDLDVKPGEACVRDCKERQRIKTLECKEVVRRVVAKLEEIGCRSIGTLNEEKVCGVCPGVEA